MNKVETIIQEIKDYIKKDNGNVVDISFQERSRLKFWSKKPRVTVSIKTYSVAKGMTFLMTTNSGEDKFEALYNAYNYIVNKHCQNSFSVEWAKYPEKVSHTSYFYCDNFQKVLDKFYNGNNPNAYTIFSIKLNPIS